MRNTILILFAFASIAVSAQDTNYVDPNYKAEKSKAPKEKSSFGKRTYFGGTFGITFGSYTSVLLEPMMGIKLTEKLSSGVGIGIRYGKYSNGPEFTNYIGRVFARYRFIPKLYGHVEYMVENYDKGIFDVNKRVSVPFLFVGAGFVSPAGRNGSFIFQVLFNVIQNEDSQAAYPSNYPYLTLGYIGGF